MFFRLLWHRVRGHNTIFLYGIGGVAGVTCRTCNTTHNKKEN